MSSLKSQHTLPRFYLSGFCDREIHRREDHERDRSRCRVWVHDKEQDNVRVRGIKKLTTENHYYSLETPGGGTDAHPEQELSRLEGAAAPIIRKLYFGPWPLARGGGGARALLCLDEVPRRILQALRP